MPAVVQAVSPMSPHVLLATFMCGGSHCGPPPRKRALCALGSGLGCKGTPLLAKSRGWWLLKRTEPPAIPLGGEGEEEED